MPSSRLVSGATSTMSTVSTGWSKLRSRLRCGSPNHAIATTTMWTVRDCPMAAPRFASTCPMAAPRCNIAHLASGSLVMRATRLKPAACTSAMIAITSP